MEKIPKALELFQTGEFTKIQDAMIQFAKLHVEAALKDASEKIKLTDEVCEVLQEHWFEEYIDKSSILNSYPLENIK